MVRKKSLWNGNSRIFKCLNGLEELAESLQHSYLHIKQTTTNSRTPHYRILYSAIYVCSTYMLHQCTCGMGESLVQNCAQSNTWCHLISWERKDLHLFRGHQMKDGLSSRSTWKTCREVACNLNVDASMVGCTTWKIDLQLLNLYTLRTKSSLYLKELHPKNHRFNVILVANRP